MAWCTMCRPNWEAARSLAMRPRPGWWLARRAPSALLDTARRSTCGRWLGQPALALRQACGWAITASMPVQRVDLAQQVVAHQQADLAHHMHGRVQEQVERARDHAFGGVLHAYHAVLGTARGGGVEHFVKVGAVRQVGCAAKKLDALLVRKRCRQAQVPPRAAAPPAPGRPT
jgi:hypothetical protein